MTRKFRPVAPAPGFTMRLRVAWAVLRGKHVRLYLPNGAHLTTGHSRLDNASIDVPLGELAMTRSGR